MTRPRRSKRLRNSARTLLITLPTNIFQVLSEADCPHHERRAPAAARGHAGPRWRAHRARVLAHVHEGELFHDGSS